MIEIEGLSIAGLYLLLKRLDGKIDKNMMNLTDDLEAFLYNNLSIQEMEDLEKLYEQKDVRLKEKLEIK